MKPTLLFLYGPPAAGKTTYAKGFVEAHPDFKRISADEIRKELYGSEDIYGDGYVIYQKILARMRKALISGKSVIYDATNLRKSYRLDYLGFLTDVFCFKEILCLVEDKQVCIERHKKRGRNIPVEDLLPFFEIDEPPTLDEGWDRIVYKFPLKNNKK